MTKKFAPVHPGEILLEEFLKPMRISQYRLAHGVGVHPRRINEIVHGQRTITADTALRLSRYFGLSERFWLNLQARYDLEVEKNRVAGRLEKEVKVLATSRAAQAHGRFSWRLYEGNQTDLLAVPPGGLFIWSHVVQKPS